MKVSEIGLMYLDIICVVKYDHIKEHLIKKLQITFVNFATP